MWGNILEYESEIELEKIKYEKELKKQSETMNELAKLNGKILLFGYEGQDFVNKVNSYLNDGFHIVSMVNNNGSYNWFIYLEKDKENKNYEIV